MNNRCFLAVVAGLLFFGGCKEDPSAPPAGNDPVRDTTMVAITGGTFQMGSPSGVSDELPAHTVTVASFNMDKYEVTYDVWYTVRSWAATHGYTDLAVGENGFNPVGIPNPVTMLNWYDVAKWCNARSEMNGMTPVYYSDSTQTTVYRTGNIDLVNGAVKRTANGYRLPTEAEWEFAARGGTLTHGYTYSGSNDINAVAWYSLNSGTTTHAAGTLAANELGLFDMSGNVWEWVWDWYGTYPSAAQTNTQGPTSGSFRVLRGGSFQYVASYCRVPVRSYGSSSSRYEYFGFRCVHN